MRVSLALPRFERRDLRLTPVVVQSSYSRWMAAPHLPQVPDETSRPDRPNRRDVVQPAVPTKDDIVGWPDEIIVDFPYFPDRTLDAVANDMHNMWAARTVQTLSG